jgi:O-antigen/teichoic acid export membrane protein
MAVTLPLALLIDAPWAVVACWGSGTLIGAVMGFFQTRLRPGSVVGALHWWRKDGWPLGRWLAAGGLLNALSLQVAVFFLASSLGSVAIGGFRAVQTVFAPMTMLGPAAALPGLPRLVRAFGASVGDARRLAAKISLLIAGLTTAYVALVWLAGSRLLVLFFGRSFEGFENLILPMSTGQLLLAGGLGFALLLKAAKRGDTLMITRVVSAVASIVLVPWLGLTYGLLGAAWGFVLASLLENGCVVALALTDRFGTHRRAGRTIPDPEPIAVPVGAGKIS